MREPTDLTDLEEADRQRLAGEERERRAWEYAEQALRKREVRRELVTDIGLLALGVLVAWLVYVNVTLLWW